MTKPIRRNAFTIIELLTAIAIIGLLIALILPAVQSARESARQVKCLNNIRQVGIALHSYHEAFRSLPPFAVWGGPPGEPLGLGVAPVGVMDRVALGLAPGSEPDRSYANWLVMLLPFFEQTALSTQYDPKVPVSDTANAGVRMAEVPVLKCPSDPNNGSNNRYDRARLVAGIPNEYSRGNYAMNLGPNRNCMIFPDGSTTSSPCPDGFHVDGTDLTIDNTQYWGSGIGGANVSMGFNDMPSGLSNLVAVDEIRAGVHPLDPRGAWALGFVAASGTARHGLLDGAEDDNGPNNTGPSSDDIVGCTELKAAVTAAYLTETNMPCFSGAPGTEINAQATARSLHPSGVHVLMMDGSAHFISDNINAEVWHQIHRREGDTIVELPF